MSIKHTLLLLPLVFLFACSGDNPDDDSFNVFSTSQDISLGKNMRDEVVSNTFEYEVWNRAEHAEAYELLDSVKNVILGSGKVFYKDEFPWEIYIVHDDEMGNAFCAPGGYIFIYTGLMKYVHNVDELAGVMAHEIAHADRRHSTDQLTKDVGISIALSLVFGDDGSFFGDLASSLFSLNYSRKNEKEADEYGVSYLCGSGLEPDASKRFFQRLQEEEEIEIPTFASTHPDHGSRVETLEGKVKELNCSVPEANVSMDPRLVRLFLLD